MGIERHHRVRPPEGRTNRDATIVGKWGISRGSAQNIWDRRKGKNKYLSRKLRAFKLQRGNSRGLSPPLSANIQGINGSGGSR